MADADTAVLCSFSFEGAAQQIKIIVDIIFVSQQIQIQRNIIFELFPLWIRTKGIKIGKKKAYTALLQCKTFLCRKKLGPQRKDFGGRNGFPGFYRVCVSTTCLESFSLKPEKSSKRFSFGGGSVRFFLLCLVNLFLMKLVRISGFSSLFSWRSQ